MLHRIALLCLSLLLIASGTASAVQTSCPVTDAGQKAHVMMDMGADCDMGTMNAGSKVPPTDPDGSSHATACCCPAIASALPSAPAPDGLGVPYPPLFDIPFDASPISVASVPEPPPPRA